MLLKPVSFLRADTGGGGGGNLAPRYTDSFYGSGGETDFTFTFAMAKTGLTVGNNLLVSVHWNADTTGTIASVGLVGDTAVTTAEVDQNPLGLSQHISLYLVPITASPGDLQVITGGGAEVAVISVDIFEIDSSWTLQNSDEGITSDVTITANVTDVAGGMAIGYAWTLGVDTPNTITGVTEPTADADSNAYVAGNGGFADRGTVGLATGIGSSARAVTSSGADGVRLVAASVWA